MKKIISCLMAFAVISSALTPFNCFAENTSENNVSYTDEQGNNVYVTEDGFEYKIENDEITIKRYTGDAVDLTVPDYIDGLPVTIIYSLGRDLETVNLPNTVKALYGTFFSCKKLTSIKLPDSIEQLDGGVFSCCYNLESVELPSQLKTLGDSTFSACLKLKSIDIPNTVTSIGDRCFKNCEILEEIIIPDSVIDIGTSCFLGCEALTKLKLSSNIKSFPCVEKKETHVTCDGRYEDTYYRYSYNFSCKKLEKIIIPEGFEKLGEWTFDGCDNLKYVVLPKSLTSWKSYTNTPYTAFSNEHTIFEATLYCYPDTAVYSYLQEVPRLTAKVIGDVSGNNEIDSSDALTLLNTVVGNSEKTDDMEVCDFDYDNEITSADVLTLLNYIVGNIDSLY